MSPEGHRAVLQLTRQRRLAAVVFLAFFIAALYEFPMHVRLVEPIELRPTALDLALPFLEWTIWLYCSYFVFLFLPFMVCRDDARVWRVGCGLMVNAILACAIFLACPTVTVGQQPNASDVTALLWQTLQAVDRPANLFPSLHVANTWVCAVALRRESNGWRHVAPVWAGLIMLATVTTKQHLLIDVPAGVALGIFSYWLVRR